MSYICLSHDLCHCCKLKASDWCATVNLHSPPHAAAGRAPFTSRGNQDARLEEERRQQAHAVNSKGVVYNMTQTSVLIRHSCSQKRLVIVWLLLQTHRATFIFYIGAHNLLYSGLFSGYNSWRLMCRLPRREKQSRLSTWRVGALYLPEKRSNSIPEKKKKEWKKIISFQTKPPGEALKKLVWFKGRKWMKKRYQVKLCQTSVLNISSKKLRKQLTNVLTAQRLQTEEG